MSGGARDLRSAVARYGLRMHAVVGGEHHVVSPLGAWLVLALAGTGAGGAPAGALAQVLGMDCGTAARAARDLLDRPAPAVRLAAAAWTSTGGRELRDWLAGLPAPVERGPVPSQDQADAWARDHTGGLVAAFPLQLDPTVRLLLATALATRIRWSMPYLLSGAEDFRGPWRQRLHAVLRTPPRGHMCAVMHSEQAGDVAVHRASGSGLTVTSVVAADDVPVAKVIAAAYDAAARVLPRRSLFDLPLGDGAAWTVTETPADHRQEHLAAVLPAWSAQNTHDLDDPALGFPAAAAMLAPLVHQDTWQAAQTVVAHYTRLGFDAAAVSYFATLESSMAVLPGPRRDALLRFDHPYAVVATTGGPPPWSGLPVFSAWVAQPEDAT